MKVLTITFQISWDDDSRWSILIFLMFLSDFKIVEQKFSFGDTGHNLFKSYWLVVIDRWQGASEKGNRTFKQLQTASPLKPMVQYQPNFKEVLLWWSSLKLFKDLMHYCKFTDKLFHSHSWSNVHFIMSNFSFCHNVKLYPYFGKRLTEVVYF